MKASKSSLIQKKFLNELTDSESTTFNQLMESDSDFVKEYQMVDDLMKYMTDKELYDFRTQIQGLSKEYKHKNKSGKIVTMSSKWSLVASIAAVAILIFGSYFFINREVSREQLFEDYYNTDELFLNTRSGNSVNDNLLEQGLMLFEKRKYEESIDYFEQIPNSVTALYYSGVAHMEINEFEVAEYKFDQVITDYLNVFYDQAHWYKGLCLMKQNKDQEAKGVFKAIAQSNSYYKDQAQELAKELK